MTDRVDIRALAKLARLDVSDAEVSTLETEIPGIIAFVDSIQKAEVAAGEPIPAHRNVMREDDNPIESGTYTERLLQAAPAVEGNRIAVKQVISRKK